MLVMLLSQKGLMFAGTGLFLLFAAKEFVLLLLKVAAW